MSSSNSTTKLAAQSGTPDFREENRKPVPPIEVGKVKPFSGDGDIIEEEPTQPTSMAFVSSEDSHPKQEKSISYSKSIE